MKTPITILLLVTLLMAAPVSLAGELQLTQQTHSDRAIKLEIVLNAPVDKVWKAWTTREGIRTFFAPDCDIDLRVLGKYDILFNPSAPAGLRGAENNLILAIQEAKLLSFTWDAPANFPSIRKQRTSVVIRLTELESNKTKLSLTHTGWGEGAEWNQVYDYFVVAWGDVVLPFLKHSLERGPIDWKNPPQKLPKATLIAD
ncbi:MAG TPA: SRPBCC domain-containing protein [Pyrinomonadaceae bacterium]|nr:SRPBCC domain-containing protein [Pyrinomonadaceae bacterium]